MATLPSTPSSAPSAQADAATSGYRRPGAVPTFAQHSFFQYPITLTGRVYVLRWYWLDRTASWYLDIMLPDGTRLASGIRIVVNFSLLLYRRDERLPAGKFLAIDRSGQNLDPEAQEDLGDRVVVLYYEPNQIPDVPSTSYAITISETP